MGALGLKFGLRVPGYSCVICFLSSYSEGCGGTVFARTGSSTLQVDCDKVLPLSHSVLDYHNTKCLLGVARSLARSLAADRTR